MRSLSRALDMVDDRTSRAFGEGALASVETLQDPPPRRFRPLRWLVALSLVLLAIILPFLLFEERILGWVPALLEALRARPFVGGALLVALLAGDVVLPVPSSLVSASAGAAFGWRVGAAVIWLGMTLGCLFGYGLGRSAGRLLMVRLVGEAELARARGLFADAGPVALVVTRAVPVLAEAGLLAAGAARMPIGRFLVSTSLANAAVAIAYALVGAAAAGAQSFLLLFLGLALIPTVGWSLWALRRRGAPADG
jgi:uncharacterized membrane protein YdjX (TVP38/TMEM64 family)